MCSSMGAQFIKHISWDHLATSGWRHLFPMQSNQEKFEETRRFILLISTLFKSCGILVWSLRPTLCCGHSSHIILLCNRLVLLRVASVTRVLVYEFSSGTTFSASTCTCKTSLDPKILKYKDVNPKLQCQVFIDCKSESTSWFTLNVNLRNCKSF